MKLKTVLVNSLLVLFSVGITLAIVELLAPYLGFLQRNLSLEPDPSPRLYFEFQQVPSKIDFNSNKVPKQVLTDQPNIDPLDKDYGGMFKNGDSLYMDLFKLYPNKSVEVDLKQISTGKSLFRASSAI